MERTPIVNSCTSSHRSPLLTLLIGAIVVLQSGSAALADCKYYFPDTKALLCTSYDEANCRVEATMVGLDGRTSDADLSVLGAMLDFSDCNLGEADLRKIVDAAGARGHAIALDPCRMDRKKGCALDGSDSAILMVKNAGKRKLEYRLSTKASKNGERGVIACEESCDAGISLGGVYYARDPGVVFLWATEDDSGGPSQPPSTTHHYRVLRVPAAPSVATTGQSVTRKSVTLRFAKAVPSDAKPVIQHVHDLVANSTCDFLKSLTLTPFDNNGDEVTDWSAACTGIVKAVAEEMQAAKLTCTVTFNRAGGQVKSDSATSECGRVYLSFHGTPAGWRWYQVVWPE